MANKGETCAGCHNSRVVAPPNQTGLVECHVRSVQDWFVREPTDWCDEWKDPKIVYHPSHRGRRLGAFRYLNQLLTWPKG